MQIKNLQKYVFVRLRFVIFAFNDKYRFWIVWQ